MLVRHLTICAMMLAGAVGLAANSASALTSKECSAKYKAAKAAGTLGGMKWNEFRKAQCGSEAAAEPAAAAPPPAATPPAEEAASTTPPPAAPVATGNIVFPPTVSSKYSSDSPAGLVCTRVVINTEGVLQAKRRQRRP